MVVQYKIVFYNNVIAEDDYAFSSVSVIDGKITQSYVVILHYRGAVKYQIGKSRYEVDEPSTNVSAAMEICFCYICMRS